MLATVPRSGIAAAAFCLQLALGAVYAWSVFLNPRREHFAAMMSAAIYFQFLVVMRRAMRPSLSALVRLESRP